MDFVLHAAFFQLKLSKVLDSTDTRLLELLLFQLTIHVINMVQFVAIEAEEFMAFFFPSQRQMKGKAATRGQFSFAKP